MSANAATIGSGDRVPRQFIRQPFDRPRQFRQHRTRASRPALDRKRRPFDRVPRRIPANIGTPPEASAPVSGSEVPASRAASLSGDRPRRRNAAQPFDRVPPVSLSGKPWRPLASRHHRTPERRATVRPCAAPVSGSEVPASRGDHVPPASDDSGGQAVATVRADSGQCRRILPAVCATVGRPPCYRGNRSRLARLFSPETRRKRPPLRPPAPDGFAPVTPRRALARPFNAA